MRDPDELRQEKAMKGECVILGVGTSTATLFDEARRPDFCPMPEGSEIALFAAAEHRNASQTR